MKRIFGKAPRLTRAESNEGDRPESPSLIRSTSETAPAVGRCFDECHELYGLISTASTGSFDRHGTAVTLCSVSKQFEQAVHEAIDAWCVRYLLLQSAYAREALRAPLADNSRVFMSLHQHAGRAFGTAYVDALDDVLLLSSCMDRRTYMHVHARRCVLCENSMPRNPERHIEWYVHAHSECAAKHCVPKTAITCMLTSCQVRQYGVTALARDTPPRLLDDAVAEIGRAHV